MSPDDPVTFANLEFRVPSIYTFPNRVLRRLRRILKSHDVYDPRYPRVIYIVRDTRDVAVSFYHYNLKVRRFTDEVTLDEFVDRFVSAKIWPSVDIFGSWENHVLSWVKMRGETEHFCFVRYEDMLRDPIAELKKMTPLLKINPSPETLARAVELSSADRMSALEKSQTGWVSTKGTRKDKPFVRAAKSGDWQSALSETSVRKIEQAWGPTIRIRTHHVPKTWSDRDRRSLLFPESDITSQIPEAYTVDGIFLCGLQRETYASVLKGEVFRLRTARHICWPLRTSLEESFPREQWLAHIAET
jgi:sulfotransferase family protein